MLFWLDCLRFLFVCIFFSQNIKLFLIFFFFFGREVPLKDAKEYAESIGAIVVETSAKNAVNIEELFQGISK